MQNLCFSQIVIHDDSLDFSAKSQFKYFKAISNLIIPGIAIENSTRKNVYITFDFINLIFLTYSIFAKNSLYNQIYDYAKVYAHANIKDEKKWEYLKDYDAINSYYNYYGYNNIKILYNQYHALLNEDENYWAWDSKDHRAVFSSMLEKYKIYKNYISLSLGLLVLNRLLSTIDYIYFGSSFQVSLQRNITSSSYRITLTKKF